MTKEQVLKYRLQPLSLFQKAALVALGGAITTLVKTMELWLLVIGLTQRKAMISPTLCP